jgi:methyl-accepting chemotaxis protein
VKDLLNRTSIGVKLWLAPGITVVMLLLVAALGLLSMQRQQSVVSNLVEVRNPNLMVAIAVEQHIKRIHAQSYQLLAWGTASYSAEQVQRLATEIDASLNPAIELARAMDKLPGLSAEEASAIQRLQAAVQAFTKDIRQVLEMADTDQSVATTMMIKSEATFTRLNAELDAIRLAQTQSMNEASVAATTAFRQVAGVSAAVVTGCLVLAGLITWLVRQSIIRSVQRIRDSASRLKDRDLSPQPPVQGSDEIALTARALVDTVETLRATIESIGQGSTQIDSAIGEIAKGNADFSTRTERAASTLQAAAAAMSELSGKVSDSAHRASDSARMAGESRQEAEQGGQAVSDVVQVMGEITTAARQIQDITGVIDSIAFQTNILALNAAVESARAGEHGRGFAVVAAEVRALSQRSASAAAEIKQLIGSSVERVEAGAHRVGQAGEAMDRIIARARQMSEMVGQIADAASDQSRTVQTVARSITELETSTQQNAALVEQAAAAAGAVRNESQALVNAVGAFRLG